MLNYLVFNIVYGHFSFSLASYSLSLTLHFIYLCMGLTSPDYGSGEVHNTAIISNEEEFARIRWHIKLPFNQICSLCL